MKYMRILSLVFLPLVIFGKPREQLPVPNLIVIIHQERNVVAVNEFHPVNATRETHASIFKVLADRKNRNTFSQQSLEIFVKLGRMIDSNSAYLDGRTFLRHEI